MLLRQYGTTVQSVEPNFDSNAINEVSFRRDRGFSLPLEDFDSQYERIGEEEIGGKSDGPVQSEAESALLDELESRLRSLLSELGEGEVLLVESQSGVDYPKLKDRKEGVIVEGENRLIFHWRVDPPLKLGRFRHRDS